MRDVKLMQLLCEPFTITKVLRATPNYRKVVRLRPYHLAIKRANHPWYRHHP